MNTMNPALLYFVWVYVVKSHIIFFGNMKKSERHGGTVYNLSVIFVCLFVCFLVDIMNHVSHSNASQTILSQNEIRPYVKQSVLFSDL